MSLKESWPYWACQITGWGSYSVAAFATATAFAGWRMDIVIGFALFFCYSIGLTHLLRWCIRRNRWLQVPARRGLPRLLGSAIALGAFDTALVVLIANLLQDSNVFDTTGIAGTAAGIVSMTCAWAAIYVGVHWYRSYRLSQLRAVETELSLRHAELR